MVLLKKIRGHGALNDELLQIQLCSFKIRKGIYSSYIRQIVKPELFLSYVILDKKKEIGQDNTGTTKSKVKRPSTLQRLSRKIVSLKKRQIFQHFVYSLTLTEKMLRNIRHKQIQATILTSYLKKKKNFFFTNERHCFLSPYLFQKKTRE